VKNRSMYFKSIVSVLLIILMNNILNAQNMNDKIIKWKDKDVKVEKNSVLLKFPENSEKQNLFSKLYELDYKVVRGPNKIGILKVKIPENMEVEDALIELKALNIFEDIEPNAVMTGHLAPNDEYYNNQWHHEKINSENAWNLTIGKSSVKIAILDSGIPIQNNSLSHVDLSNNRITLGYDYIEEDDYPNDEYGHGTHVTGLLSAESDNSDGIRLSNILSVKRQ